MAAKLPYFKWYAKDAQTDEDYRSMSFEERGFFRDCLDFSWVNGGLSTDPVARARVIGCAQADHDRLWAVIEHRFQQSDGRFFNDRLELERTNAISKSEKASKSVAQRGKRSIETVSNDTSNDRANDHPRAYESESESASESSSGGAGGNPFLEAGWSSSEDFEVWWDDLVKKHPNRNRNAVAKSLAIDQLRLKRWTREAFECGYVAIRKTAGNRWSDDNGSFAPNLYAILDDRLWDVPGPKVELVPLERVSKPHQAAAWLEEIRRNPGKHPIAEEPDNQVWLRTKAAHA